MKLFGRTLTRNWAAGFVVAAFSLILLLTEMRRLGIDADNMYIASLVICVAAGIFAMIYEMKPLTSAAFFTICLNIRLAVMFYDTVTSDNLLEFTYGLAFELIAALSIIFSISLYVGYKYNTVRIKYLQYILIGVVAVRILIASYNLNSLPKGIVSEAFYIKELVYCAVLIYLVDDKRIKFRSCNSRMIKYTRTLTSVMCNDPLANILRSDLKRIMDRSTWTPTEGPFVSEIDVTLIATDSKMFLVFREQADGTVSGEMTYSPESTSIQNLKFILRSIDVYEGADECRQATFYGSDGFFITVMISDDDTDREYTLRQRIYRLLFGIDRKEMNSIRAKLRI